MDSELQAKADAEAAALQRDIEYLEHKAAAAGKSLAVKLGRRSSRCSACSRSSRGSSAAGPAAACSSRGVPADD